MKLKLLAAALVPAGLALTAPHVSAAEQTLGALFQFNGLLGGNPVSGSIYDGDIHSGVFRDVNASPSGLSGPTLLSDSYVLQGGDPFGGDTGDAFEESQSQGHAVVGGFDIFTNYLHNNDGTTPGNQVGNIIYGAPDTGVLTFANNTGQEFVGDITLSGTAFGGIYGPAQDFLNTAHIDLISGASVNIVLNNESSNYGGYNHPSVVGTPTPDGGATLALLGTALAGLLPIARRTRK